MEFLVDYSCTGIPREAYLCNFIWEKPQQFSLSYQLTEQASHLEKCDKIQEPKYWDVFPVASRKLHHQSENWSIIPINAGVLKNHRSIVVFCFGLD